MSVYCSDFIKTTFYSILHISMCTSSSTFLSVSTVLPSNTPECVLRRSFLTQTHVSSGWQNSVSDKLSSNIWGGGFPLMIFKIPHCRTVQLCKYVFWLSNDSVVQMLVVKSCMKFVSLTLVPALKHVSAIKVVLMSSLCWWHKNPTSHNMPGEIQIIFKVVCC